MQKRESASGTGDGIKRVRRKLADGSFKTYEYKRSEIKPRRTIGALRDLFNHYAEDTAFTKLAKRWQAQALVHMRTIEDELGWMTPDDLEAAATARRAFYSLQKKFADTPYKADLMLAVLSMALAWAYDRGMLNVNHCVKIKRLVNPRQSPHRDKCLTEEQEAMILSAAPQEIIDLYEFALYTGLRRGDICALPATAMDKAGVIHWQPSKTRGKTGLWVHLPATEMPPLQAVIERMRSRGNVVSTRLVTRDGGVPWSLCEVSERWSEAMAALGIDGIRFHDIRHTTSTRLVLAGCTEAERGLILGHATSEGIGAIYTARLQDLATNAYRKWWKYLQDQREKAPSGLKQVG